VRFAGEIENPGAGNLTLNHIPVETLFNQPPIPPKLQTEFFHGRLARLLQLFGD